MPGSIVAGRRAGQENESCGGRARDGPAASSACATHPACLAEQLTSPSQLPASRQVLTALMGASGAGKTVSRLLTVVPSVGLLPLHLSLAVRMCVWWWAGGMGCGMWVGGGVGGQEPFCVHSARAQRLASFHADPHGRAGGPKDGRHHHRRHPRQRVRRPLGRKAHAGLAARACLRALHTPRPATYARAAAPWGG